MYDENRRVDVKKGEIIIMQQCIELGWAAP
jgi:hypothetical protein